MQAPELIRLEAEIEEEIASDALIGQETRQLQPNNVTSVTNEAAPEEVSDVHDSVEVEMEEKEIASDSLIGQGTRHWQPPDDVTFVTSQDTSEKVSSVQDPGADAVDEDSEGKKICD